MGRLIVTAARAALGSKSPVGRYHHRVWPRYVDLNRHMNQAAYAEVMELARWHWMVRSGMFRTMVRQRLNVVVGRQEIIYRRELKPLAAFVIDVRATRVERRAVQIEHHFIVGERVHAKGTADLVVLGRDGVAPADTVRDAFGSLVQTPLHIEDWRVA